MPLNISTILPAVLKAKEVATQEYVDTTTANAIAGSGFVLPTEVAAAINNNTTTIDGSKITTGTIQAGAIAAGAITTDKLAAGSITTNKIAAGSVGSINIADTLQSDNYVAGSSGWKIGKDSGSIEVSDGVFRGQLQAGKYSVITESGLATKAVLHGYVQNIVSSSGVEFTKTFTIPVYPPNSSNSNRLSRFGGSVIQFFGKLVGIPITMYGDSTVNALQLAWGSDSGTMGVTITVDSSSSTFTIGELTRGTIVVGGITFLYSAGNGSTHTYNIGMYPIVELPHKTSDTPLTITIAATNTNNSGGVDNSFTYSVFNM